LARIIYSDINTKGYQVANKKLKDIQVNIDALAENADTNKQQLQIEELKSLYNLALDTKIRRLLTDKWPYNV